MEERKAGRKIVMRFTAALMTFVMFCVLFAPTEVHAARKPKLNKTKIMIAVGDKTQLKMTGTTKKVVWKSSNKRVATVTAKGVVKAKKAGKATITAKHKGKTYKCKVTVVKPSISRKTLALNVGRTAKLTIRGAMSKVQWSSSNPRVAKVGKTSGKVTAVGAGKATIKGKFLGKTYKCVVTVKKNGITLSAQNLVCKTAGEESVKVTYTGTGSLVWEVVSGKDVVTVRWGGDDPTELFVRPLSVGTAKVRIYSKDNPKTETFLTVTIPKNKWGINLREQFAEYIGESWFDVGGVDGGVSGIMLSTHPSGNDTGHYVTQSAINGIKNILHTLPLPNPDDLWNRMLNELSGKVSYEGIEVVWGYTDYGLTVIIGLR